MLTEEHFDLFRKFRIRAMGDKLREMIDDPAYDDMTFEDKMAELLETEASARRERKIAKLNREAGFKLPAACVENIVYLPDGSSAATASPATPAASGSRITRCSS